MSSDNTSEYGVSTQKQRLRGRHVQMIALGGAIGTGVFYGSADAIRSAGPAVLLVYLVGGLAIFAILRALGEMTVYEPSSGAFSHYADKYWSKGAGFVSGWNYWFNYIAVSMVELSVIGSFVNYWFPNIPPWISAAFFLFVITALNLFDVRFFGEFEFWFSLVKVLAILGMIFFGLFLIISQKNISDGLPKPSVSHLFDYSGFAPFGLKGMLFALVVVMFSFGGTELIAVAAGETENPTRSIPRAINQVLIRILIFYVGSLFVIMCVVPWFMLDGKISPFVQMFDSSGISGGAHILNFVALTAALSVYNSGLYSNSRMLFSLSRQKNAPKFLGSLSSTGVPRHGVLVSSAITFIAVIIVFFEPNFAFDYLISIALFAGLTNWCMILITHWKFRRSLSEKERGEIKFRFYGASFFSVLTLVFLGFIVFMMLNSDQYRIAILIGPVWILFLIMIYGIKARFLGRS